MRSIVVAVLFAGSAAVVVPAAAGGEPSPSAAPGQDMSVLAMTLTAGGAAATVGSGIALGIARRRAR